LPLKSERIDFLENNLKLKLFLLKSLNREKIVRKEDLVADTNDSYYTKRNAGSASLSCGQDFYNKNFKQVSAKCECGRSINVLEDVILSKFCFVSKFKNNVPLMCIRDG